MNYGGHIIRRTDGRWTTNAKSGNTEIADVQTDIESTEDMKFGTFTVSVLYN